MNEFESVPIEQLTEQVTILDVREQYEWDEGHIAGAVHLPLDELPLRFEELDPDEDLYVICRTGGRSFRAVQWLIAQGYSAFNVAGGMGAWQDAEKPMVSENGQPPQVR
ncbi:rhodanese-related sulfurtransferase [Psychromicrobium silvestre]|uniref:Rhodanese-related sulfurtransferase n=1 Tax=Psychromicrobium silvestre TaxID=1645614 RepID=A0A7Y9LUZ2_9MICC|nr:rhodanese-like domain-containing protein [Psychromicrobium silvestre]NYE96044.1 rhodanese-related sulfurtransferase [Psychromicrobium silvestre]